MLKNIVIVNDCAHIEGGAASVAINSAIGLAKHYSVYLFSAVQPIDRRLEEVGVRVICMGKRTYCMMRIGFVQYLRDCGITKQSECLNAF